MLRIDPSLDEEYDYNVAAAASGVGGGSSSKPATTPTPTSASAAGVRQNQSYNHSSPPNPTTKNHYDYYSNMMMSSADEPELLMPVDESKDDSADLNQTTTSAQDALLDLAELEELQNEAEKCKSLGNKHMASQEYLAAYHSYSAALQLSPVGPSSHVFLSNRAAALLSLKRYRDAATDARRAIALAPTFGKAHARLGQALYFLKEYDKAKAAYEDALRFEPDNPVTQTYWEKAVQKLERQQQRQQQQNHQQQRGVSDISSTAEESSTLLGGFSVATDRHLDHRIVDQNYNRGNHDTRATLLKQVTSTTTRSPPPSMKESPRSPSSPENLPSLRQPQQPPPPHPSTDEEDEYNYDDDPEFQEAMRIQQRANAFLANKKYRQAIEEYTAALFLVPDDVHLSSDLHLGRAHALNGSRRHEAARNDAILALKLKPSPAGYSTLAKTLFYLGEYQACVDAFADCVQLLPPGEKTLGLFDQAYLEKAQNAITEEDASLGNAGKILNRSNASSASSSGQPQHHSPDKIPKLPPPRFVPREEALMRPIPAAKSMPKSWPTQSSRDSAEPLRCGKERQVVCYSEALGIKLNRGPDGIVRVLKVAHTNPQLLRQGSTIQIGDIIREAAGVDLRRPITNIMWGDTVALIKMAPRPIVLVIAEELSPIPTAVLEEHRKIMALEQPSRASDDAPVRNNNESATTPATHADPPLALLDDDEEDDDDDDIVEVESPAFTQDPKTESALSEKPLTNDEGQLNTPASSSSQEQPSLDATVVTEENEEEQSATAVESTTLNTSAEDDDIVEVEGTEENSKPAPSAALDVWAPQGIVEMPPTLREEEDRILGNKEILFEQDASACYNGWDTLRWMSYSGARNISFSQTIYRRFDGVDKRKRKGGIPLFWKTGNSGTRYESRFLIAYDDPSVILIVRPPESIEEIQQILGLSELGASMAPQQDGNDPLESFWVLESVIEPAFCKLRLSALTTPTSIPSNTATYDCAHRERSCFELITPSETIVLSVVDVRPGAKKKEQSFTDSGAFLETFSAETSIAQFICEAHSHHIEKNEDDNHNNSRGPVKDISWKHQVIIGSLHSLVLSGNIKALEEGIIYAKESYARTDVNADPNFLPTRIVDALDDNGYSPIYYACSRHQLHPAVRALVQAGANATYQSEVDGTTLLHIAAQNLDDKTLCTLLSASHPRRPDPNVVDKHGRTPMYVAMVKGSFMDGGKDPPGLGRCIASLKAWGGKLLVPGNKLRVRNPINALATMWLPDYLTVVFDGHVPFRFPLESNECLDCGPVTISLGALYEYPIHSAILSLRKQVRKQKFTDSFAIESSLVRTLRVLFEHGFEQNERLDRGSIAPIKMSTEWAQELTEFVGYSPLQILAYIALELDATKEGTGRKVHERCMQLVSETAEFLVKNGARLSMEPPLTARRRQEGMPSPSNTDEVVRVELLSKKIESDDHLLNLLGGKERLLLAKKEWEQLDKVSTMCTNVLDEYKEAFEESTSGPGGSDSLSCAICWSEFGAFVNRKHKCRVSRKFVCDDCSSKRLVQVSTEYRLSDGQFLLARVDAARERDATTMAKEEAKTRNSEHARAAARLDRLEAEEKASRDSLFSGFVERATNFVMGDENEKSSTSRQIEGLSSTLNQTRDALNQRGEKLATLNDKSAQLVDASANFAQMATELRKKSEKGIFGW